MKKLLSMAAAATMLFAVSCSDADDYTPNGGGDGTVTFTLQLPDGVGTRAIGDGTTAKDLTYAVYESGETEPVITGAKGDVTFNADLTATVSLRLVTGKTYDFVFFADASEGSPYTFDAAGQSVAVSYEGVVSNDERRDAFFATRQGLKVDGQISEKITLRRPFAQLNVGTVDLPDAVKAGLVEGDMTTQMVAPTYGGWNLMTGEVTGEARDVTFAFAARPADPSVLTLKDDKREFAYLSMNYLLAKSDKELVNCKFTVKEGEKVLNELALTSVPVQRNWRTNIVGSILTSQVDFEIVIDPIFTDDYLGYAELLEAAANGGTVVLQGDIVLDNTISVAPGKTMTLDLNGHTISNTKDVWDDESLKTWSIFSVKGGTLIVQGAGDVTAKDNDCYAFDVQDNGKLIIEGTGTYTGNCHSVYVHDGSAEIKSGTFKVVQPYSATYPYEYTLNCLDANYKNGTASITVTGGTFYGVNPADCRAEDPGTSFVAEGYSAIKTGETPDGHGIYTVMKGAETTEELRASLLKAGGIGVVSSDLTLTKSLSTSQSKKGVTLYVDKGVTLDIESPHPQVCATRGNLTIDGEGTIYGPEGYCDANGTLKGSLSMALETLGSGTITINGNPSIISKGKNKAGSVSAAITNYGGTITINGGYFYAYNDVAGQPNPAVYISTLTRDKHNLIITGGVFENEAGGAHLINIQDMASASNRVSVQISGGIFVGFDPAQGDKGTDITTFVAPGYKSVQTTWNGKTAWEVVPE